jgi:tetratricopeptide (TPR) repeat protein
MFSVKDIKEALRKGDFERGLAICKSILFDRKNDYAIMGYYGLFLFRLNRYVDALEVFDNLLEREEDALFLELRGDCFYGLKRNDAALKDYLKALKLDKKAISIYDKLARVYYQLGKKEKAYEAIDRAIEYSRGEDYLALKAKAVFLRFDGRTAESFRLLAELRKRFPDEEFFRQEQLEILAESLAPSLKR